MPYMAFGLPSWDTLVGVDRSVSGQVTFNFHTAAVGTQQLIYALLAGGVNQAV